MKTYLLALAFFVSGAVGLSAQVTIGAGAEPDAHEPVGTKVNNPDPAGIPNGSTIQGVSTLGNNTEIDFTRPNSTNGSVNIMSFMGFTVFGLSTNTGLSPMSTAGTSTGLSPMSTAEVSINERLGLNAQPEGSYGILYDPHDGDLHFREYVAELEQERLNAEAKINQMEKERGDEAYDARRLDTYAWAFDVLLESDYSAFASWNELEVEESKALAQATTGQEKLAIVAEFKQKKIKRRDARDEEADYRKMKAFEKAMKESDNHAAKVEAPPELVPVSGDLGGPVDEIL